jgi:hypothetical protein
MYIVTKTKVYEYNELSEDIKQKVLEKFADVNVDYDWWMDSVYDYQTNELERAGLTNPDIQFSGFYSQGDGASFASKHSVDVKKLMEFTGADVKFPDLYKGLGIDFDIACYIKRITHQSVHECSAKLTLD